MRHNYFKSIFTIIMLATLVITLLPTPQAAQAQGGGGTTYHNCAQTPRLHADSYGRVTLYPRLSNRLRATPGYHGRILDRIPPGGVFYVMPGVNSYACLNGLNWWYVNYNGTLGWTAEGNGYREYWLEPYHYVPPQPQCSPAPRLQVGGYGVVTPGLPNVIRTAPGTTASGANSTVIGQIPAGGTFYVARGPECGPDGRYWWYVEYQGVWGWTAEGENHTFWTYPLY